MIVANPRKVRALDNNDRKGDELDKRMLYQIAQFTHTGLGDCAPHQAVR